MFILMLLLVDLLYSPDDIGYSVCPRFPLIVLPNGGSEGQVRLTRFGMMGHPAAVTLTNAKVVKNHFIPNKICQIRS